MGSRRFASFAWFAAFAVGLVAQQPTNGTCRIRMWVLDENGKAIAGAGAIFGAEREVTTNDALQRPAARSDQDGALEIVVPVPTDVTQQTVLLIAAPGRVAFRHPHPERTAASRFEPLANVDLGALRLPPGHTLTGRVRDAEGEPVAGALVTGFDEMDLQQRWRPAFVSRTRTNADGVFMLPGVFANAITIDVAADGWFRRTISGVGLGTPLDVRLATSGFVEGAVRGADGAATRGTVNCVYQIADEATSACVAKDGTFRLPIQHEGQFRLSLHAPDSSLLAESDVLDGPCRDIVLVPIDDARRFLIRAKAKDGDAPIRNLRASVFWWGGERHPGIDAMLDRMLVSARSDGAVPIAAPRSTTGETGHALVRADGFAPLFVRGLAHREGGVFTAELCRESRVAGRVLDAERRPLAGVVVTCRRAEPTADPNRVQWLGPQRAGSQQVTAADGSFSFGELVAEKNVVEARWPDGTIVATATVEPAVGQVIADLELQLAPGARVIARVSGVPAGATWRVALATERPDADEGDWASGRLVAWNPTGSRPVQNGTIEFAHRAPGPTTLWLLVPQSPRQGSTIAVPVAKVDVAKDDLTLDLDLGAHRPGSIAGKLVARGLQIPPGRLVVVATKPSNEAPPRVLRSSSAERHWAAVEPDGSFVLAVEPGAHDVTVVDVATGFTVHRGPSTRVAANQVERIELNCEIAEVRVSFERRPGQRLTASRLHIHGSGTRDWPEAAMFGIDTGGFTGCNLTSIDEPVSFFAPPGALRLAFWGAATAIEFGTKTYPTMRSNDVTTVDVEAGKTNEVTLKMPLPVDLRGK